MTASDGEWPGAASQVPVCGDVVVCAHVADNVSDVARSALTLTGLGGHMSCWS